jgi:two-component system sensor histidine kinase KdpD
MQFAVVRRELRGIVLALLMVAVTTLIAYFLVKYLYLRRGSVLYLVPVLLAGWHLGLLAAMVAAIAGLLWSGYLFYSPDYTFLYFIAQPFEIINLVVFIVVAGVTSHLAITMKRQTELARRREREMSGLYTFSRRLAAAPTASDIFSAIEQHLANLTGRKVALFLTGRQSTDRTPPDGTVPAPVRAAIAQIEKGATSGSTFDDGTGNIWLIRPVSQKTPDFGVIAIDLGRPQVEAVDDMRQRVEEVLSDAAATLERLDLAYAISEAKMRAETEQLREALIGSVSHELRTPLASILGAATVLRQSPIIENNERLRSLAGVVRDEAERLNNDIQNLLDATRITRHQVKPRPEWIEPADIVNTTLDRRRRRLAGHNISIDMDSNLPFIYVDPVLTGQAFVQIVDNAAKYSPPGSTITVAAKRNGEEVELSVQDKGAGLTPDEQARVGERFFRAPRHSGTISGSGLGLWIAKAFVNANGGRLAAVSPGADQGTTVSLHLPLPLHPLEVSPDD